jgi:hypothetical protein
MKKQNGSAEVSKNLPRYRKNLLLIVRYISKLENNFVRPAKLLWDVVIEYDDECCKKFRHFDNQFVNIIHN